MTPPYNAKYVILPSNGTWALYIMTRRTNGTIRKKLLATAETTGKLIDKLRHTFIEKDEPPRYFDKDGIEIIQGATKQKSRGFIYAPEECGGDM